MPIFISLRHRLTKMIKFLEIPLAILNIPGASSIAPHERPLTEWESGSQLVARVEAQLRQRDGWIMAEVEAARSNVLLDQVCESLRGSDDTKGRVMGTEGDGGRREGDTR